MKLKILVDHCDRPYLVRIELLAAFGWSMKLHVFLRSDADEELHDHPWDFWSLVIIGGYWEVTPEGVITRECWTLVRRRAEHKHRVVLIGGSAPCATIVLTSPPKRAWGFWRNNVFIPWRKFVSGRKCE